MKIIPLVTLVVAGQSRAPGSDAVEIPDGEARNLIARGFACEADPEPSVEQEAPADGVVKAGIEAPADGTETTLTGDGDGVALQPVAPDPEPTPEPERPKGRRK
jgi:hypothetical protein